MTLIELMVASAMLLVVLTVCFGLLLSLQKATVTSYHRSSSLDQARLAVQAFDRQAQAADYIYPPDATVLPDLRSGVTTTGYSVTLHNSLAGSASCIQWRVVASTGLLQSRNWVPGASTSSGWQTVATGLVDKPVRTPTPFPPPFVVTIGSVLGTTIPASNVLNVDIWTNEISGSAMNSEAQDTTTLRNYSTTNATLCSSSTTPTSTQ